MVVKCGTDWSSTAVMLPYITDQRDSCAGADLLVYDFGFVRLKSFLELVRLLFSFARAKCILSILLKTIVELQAQHRS